MKVSIINTDEKLKLYSKEKLIDIIEKLSVEYAIKNQQYEYLRHNKKDEIELQERIDKALKYLKRLQEKELITEFETGWLIELLEGSDKDDC